jgi:hypothetical protein
MLLTSNFDIPAAPRAGVVTLEINPGWADTTFTITLDLTGDKSGRARVSRNVDGSVGTMNPVVSIPVVAGDELSVSIIVDCATGCVGSGALATVTVP